MVIESGVGGEADVGSIRFVVISAGNCGLVYTTDFLRHWPRSGHSSGFL